MPRPPASSLPLFVTVLLWVAGYGFVSTSALPQLARVAAAACVEVSDETEEIKRARAPRIAHAGSPVAAPTSFVPTRVSVELPPCRQRWRTPPARAPSAR